jgi:4-carboxymuconolactone decarboxylase
MTNREAGINVVREMMGDQAAAKLSASTDSNTFGAAIAAYAVDQVFADIWTRPGLDRRSRSLVSMSVMIAMRQPHEFVIHMAAGLDNGLTLKEIEEVLIQAMTYVGYPAIATALAAAAGVIKEHVWTATKTTLATAACFDTKRHPHCRCERRLIVQPEAIVS